MALFTRHGTEMAPTGHDLKGKPFAMIPRACGRCGGAGGAAHWARTGWTCFDCGGTGKHKNGPAFVRLFTAEKVAKLEAAKAKRDAKKRAAAEAKAAAAKAEADARRDGFLAAHGDLIKRCEPFLARNEFIADVHRKAMEKFELTDKAIAALAAAVAKCEAEDAALPVPVTDKRIAIRGTVLTIKVKETRFGPVTKMLIKHADGWKLWGTKPGNLEAARGDEVEFEAKVEAADTDPKFGFWARPTKARLIEKEAA